MADDDVAPSAPPLPDADVFGAASAPSYSEFYERQLQLREQDTSCDEAIARALAAETAGVCGTGDAKRGGASEAACARCALRERAAFAKPHPH